MDRRQRKTRDSIFRAFIDLVSEKDFAHITVGDIIERADVGRATFYSHFETKDFLLKELCGELFDHIFEAEAQEMGEGNIFNCETSDSAFLHLFRHLKKNDNNILRLLSCSNNELFLNYFKTNLKCLIKDQMAMFESRKAQELPDDFWIDHIASTFAETVRWWVSGGLREDPETITRYFMLTV